VILRRQVIAAIAGSVAPWSAPARQPGLRLLAAPQAMAQVAAGGPTGVLAVGRSGVLFALAQAGGRTLRLADGIDPDTPLAVGHGRIAARRMDGALWVGEAGRAGVSRAQALAPAAGLLVLPLAVIGVEAAGGRHRVVRLEPGGSGAWRRVARSGIDVLPDARPMQTDLDGAGDGGHLVVLAGPDAERYRHEVLGDAVEATRVTLLERHSLTVLRELALDAPHVFEDIAPRRVRLGSRDGLLTVQSGPLGAQLALVDADPASPASLRVAARGPALGTVNRWLSPTTDGRHWLAVHTPHIGGVLHEYRQEGGRLHASRIRGGVSNHRIGARQLDLAAWQGQQLLIPVQDRQRLLLLDGRSGWQRVREWQVPSRVTATASLGASGGIAMLHEDGTVSLVRISA
jgi:hypothetical protein